MAWILKVSKGAKIRNRYNQVPHLAQDTNGKVTNSQLDTTNKNPQVNPYPAGDHNAHINRCAQRQSKRTTEKNSEIFYWPFQGASSFVDSTCFFSRVFALPLRASVNICSVVTCWVRVDLLVLVCGVLLWVCYLSIGILRQVWYLIVSIPDLCTLTYFEI